MPGSPPPTTADLASIVPGADPDAGPADAVLTSSHGAAARGALAARFHVAVVAGPDAGWCHAIGPGGVVVGRDPSSDLPLADPLLSRRHVELRARGSRVEARDLGSANGTAVVVKPPRGGSSGAGRPGAGAPRAGGSGARPFRWPRGRRLGRAWRRVRPGTALQAGSSVLVVRRHPALARRSPADETGPATPARPSLLAATGLLTVLPFVLLSGTSGPRLILLLAVPVLLTVALLVPRLRAWRRATAPAEPVDPAALLLTALRGAPPVRPGGAAGGGVAPGPEPSRAVRIHPEGTEIDLDADGPVGVVGQPAAVRAVTRWLVAALAVGSPDGLDLGLAAASPPWAWAGALPRGDGPTAALCLLDALDGSALAASSSTVRRRPGTVVALVPSLAEVPAWCRTVVEVAADHPWRVSEAWAAEVAAAQRATRALSGAALPADVRTAALVDAPERAWPAADDELSAAFAVTADGPVAVDLASHGPHALVAGTTGSGKSELLLGWVLSLASRYPPSALTVVAFDYKGGSTFLPLARLPHVADVLTDLDGPGTARALAGLRAELARRERLLAAVGARDLAEYRLRAAALPGGRTGRLGRLLVVVDEFRTLADEHPDLLAALVRVAAQGRSLGIHLVLATQRPAGAVSAEMRANLSIAVCLRVLSPGDSLDVLGTAAAAHLPVRPGRALVAGLPPAGRSRPDGLLDVQAGWSGPAGTLAAFVEGIRRAATVLGEPDAAPLWAPPLPEAVAASAIADVAVPASRAPGGTPSRGLPLLLLDRPEAQRLEGWAWSPDEGPLLVVGGARSGRSTALVTVAVAALARGVPVHVVGGRPLRREDLPRPLGDHPLLGTVVGTQDPRRLRRLLDRLATDARPALLCVDDAEGVADTGGIHDGLAPLLQAAGHGGPGVALTATTSALGARWARTARFRLVLAPRDPAEATLAGVPRALLGTRWPPGRGVLLGAGEPALGQVFLPGAAPPTHAATVEAVAGAVSLPRAARDDVLRLEPIPLTVPASALAAPREAGHAVLGVGGDDAGPVGVALGAGARVVVAGPAESGRSAALRRIETEARACGLTTVRLDRSSPPSPPDGPAVYLVDDAESLAPERAEEVARLWRGREDAVVVAARSDAIAASFHGLLGEIRSARTVLVLAPLRGGTAHLPPADVLAHADPAHPRHPGRGVLVEPRRAVPVQVAAPEAGPAGAARRAVEAGQARPAGRASAGVVGALGAGERRRGDGRRRDQAREGDHGRRDQEPSDEGGGADLRDADRALDELPGQNGPAGPAPPGGEGSTRPDEERCDAAEEEHDRHARPDGKGGAADDVDHEQHASDGQRGGLEEDDEKGHGESARTAREGNTANAHGVHSTAMVRLTTVPT